MGLRFVFKSQTFPLRFQRFRAGNTSGALRRCFDNHVLCIFMANFFEMYRLFLLLFGTVSLVSHAQIPNYVPTEGLVAWYPFNGNANDESGNGFDAIPTNVELAADQFDVAESAYQFDYTEYSNGSLGDMVWVPHETAFNTPALTVSVWFKQTDYSYPGNPGSQAIIKRVETGYSNPPGEFWSITMNDEGRIGGAIFSDAVLNASSSDGLIAINEWYHAVLTYDTEILRLYINGESVAEDFGANRLRIEGVSGISMGVSNQANGYWRPFHGIIDDAGMWNRALSEEEILALYTAEPPVPGCNDSTACNYNAEATSDDGTCIPSGCLDEEACNYNPEAECAGEECDYCSCVGEFHMGVSFDYPIVSYGNGQYYTSWGGVDLSPIEGSLVTQFEGGEGFFLALKADSTAEVMCSGCNGIDESLADAKFIDIDGGRGDWVYVRADSTLGGPGENDVADVDDAVACAISWNFMMGLRANGDIVGWGGGWHEYPGEMPAIDAIDAGIWHAVALTTEGQVIEWGYEDSSGEILTSTAEISSLEGIVDISAGSNYTLAIFQDGSAKVWTWPDGNIIHDIPASEGVVDGGVNWAIFSYITYDGRVVTMNNQGLQDENLDISPQIECGRCIYDFDGNGVCNEGAILGCIDLTACNFDEEATIDDGSCIPSGCMDLEACNYNALAECEGEACDYSCCPGPGCCGEGMHWDWELEQCQNTLPGDTNGDGCVQLNDLLDVLSAYGNCGQAFSCGGVVSYQGYDYATVLIGEQCWFAENLRSENYDNGDAIPAGLSASEWSSTSSGATAVYGESASNLETYGRLYNWYAVDDARGLCPSGWHVPTDGEWMTMEMALGMSESEANSAGWRGTNQGTQMKTTYGWNNGGNGTNSIGFSGLPGGFRLDLGYFLGAGYYGYWWSSSPVDPDAWSRNLYVNNESVNRLNFNRRGGLSVRCVRDAE
jgi:uncharacterized protein (TIGR02145 family)